MHLLPISQIKPNPNNPRVIEDREFEKLVESVKTDGFMLAIRFLVIDKDNVVVGGNQRLRACQVAGLDKIFVVKADDLTLDQLREFVVKDNTYYGEWDKPMLANIYTDREMVEVGMDLIEVSQPRLETIGDIEPEIDASDLAKRKETYANNEIKQIVTYYPADLYDKVVQSLEVIKDHMKCQENNEVLLNLITYWNREYDKQSNL